ncbi:MAG: hypothetical protein H6883_13910 [Rhodobiaceae bacterium]|nr:hypothetical protein [Rhodobiaceae bacterium]MCC0057213.1 hypothetical protein [Rhodobiaceae bacterium]
MTRLARLFLFVALAFCQPVHAAQPEAEGAPAVAAPPAAKPARKPPTVTDLLDALGQAQDPAVGEVLQTQILTRWGQSGSDTVDLLMQWAMGAMEEKDFALALDLLSEIIIIKPDYAEGWNKRATVYYLIDEYALSMSDINHVLQLEPRHFGALSGLGLILKETGDKKNALAAFRRALAVNPFLDNAREAADELTVQVEGRGI